MKRILALVTVTACMLTSTAPLHAGEFFGVEDNPPSIFNYGLTGIGIGVLGGLSAGYLSYADRDASPRSKRDGMLATMGYSVVGMTAIGLAIGFRDFHTDNGVGGIVLRDIALGGKVGLLCGGIWGVVDAFRYDNSKLIGSSLSWGYLGGMALGVGIGLIEAPKIAGKNSTVAAFDTQMVYQKDSKGNMYPAMVVTKRF